MADKTRSFINLQLFADPPAGGGGTQGKTFSEEYVQALRGENASYRIHDRKIVAPIEAEVPGMTPKSSVETRM